MPALVVQTSFLGDMVLTTPLLAHLARRGPVDVVAIPASAGLLANHPAVRRVIVYDKRGADRGVRGLWRMARRLRQGAYDAAYLAQASARSGALVRLARIPERIGFGGAAGRHFYTARVHADESAHHARRLLSLGLSRADREPTSDDVRPRLYPGAAEMAAVDALLARNGYRGEPLVAVAPGSVWATKRWPYYPALARALASEFRLLVVGAAGDAELAREIAAAAGPDTIDATGQLSLLASAELIGRARVLVTNDSAPLHLASAMATPTVALFGPTVPAFGFGPLAPRAAIGEVVGLACRPCDKHGPMRCPLGHWRCMRDLAPERVLELARDLLTTRDVRYAE